MSGSTTVSTSTPTLSLRTSSETGTIPRPCSAQRSLQQSDARLACARGGAWPSKPSSLLWTSRRSCGKRWAYFVRIFFVGTDRPEINAARVARRVLQGGHEVPIRKIIDRWGHSIANAASVAAEVDRFYVYDNSVDDRDAQLVLRAADGRVVKAYGDAPAWAAPILERLAPREA